MKKERFEELMKNLDNFHDEKLTETMTKCKKILYKDQNKKYD